MPQFFSDRTFEFNGNWEPFNPAATDSLGMTIWLGYGGLYSPTLGYAITPGQVSFTLYSWGDRHSDFYARALRWNDLRTLWQHSRDR
jgi:hypothetical protein